MATIYKVEMELVSEWLSYSEEDIYSTIQDMISLRNKQEREKGNRLILSQDKLKVKKVR
jgi:hypothetical protein